MMKQVVGLWKSLANTGTGGSTGAIIINGRRETPPETLCRRLESRIAESVPQGRKKSNED
jgi:hypothetical protein